MKTITKFSRFEICEVVGCMDGMNWKGLVEWNGEVVRINRARQDYCNVEFEDGTFGRVYNEFLVPTTKPYNRKAPKPPVVKVGDGATFGIGSDRYPYSVVEVNATGTVLVIQCDNFTGGAAHDYFGDQKWVFSPNKNGDKKTIKWHRGKWIISGDKSGGINIGKRDAYQDPSF